MDPWDPGYGMGFDAANPDEDEAAVADADVETSDWSTAKRPEPEAAEPVVAFVDGVRRIEVRLIAEEEQTRAHGLFGSYAVGSVLVDGRAAFGPMSVERSVILGSGLMPEQVAVTVGRCTLDFRPACDPGADPDRPLFKLQTLMREAEAALARRLAATEGVMVLVDGPLTFFDDNGGGPVVGIVKRFARHYLNPEQTALLPRLDRGERTPLFALGTRQDQPVQRYAWYTRIAAMRPPWHGFAGIVRCDVGAGIGVTEAIRLADRVTATLPRYAGRVTDPRAPQNLAPVGGLETKLRHGLGEQRLVKRALTAWLIGQDPDHG